MLKKRSFYKTILLVSFLFILLPFTIYGSTNTRKYCDGLLISAKKEYFARNYVKSLKYLEEAQSTLTDNEQRIESLNIRALIYKDLGDYEKSMGYFSEAYKIGVKYHLYKMQSLILNNIAVLYGDKNEMDKASEYYERSYNVALKSSDSLSIGRAAINRAQVAVELGDITSAEEYISITEAHMKKDKRLMTYIQIVKSNLLFLKKEYSAAESLALGLLNSGQEIEIGHKSLLFRILSKIYYAMGDIEKAIYFVQQILAENHIIEERIIAYERLSELYTESGSFMLALQYKDSLLLEKDSLYNINNNERTETYRIRMELLDTEKTLAENKAKQKAERILFTSILIFIIILTLVLILMFRIQSIRNKQRKQLTELELEKEKNQKLIIEQQLKEQENQQEQLNNEIEIKNKQLTARILFQSNRSKLIKELITAFSDAPLQKENPILESIIQKLKLQLKDSADANNFFVQLEQINPSLFLLLKEKYSNLSLDDIHLLSYIYLYNTDTKKIASLLNIPVNACQKRKERLADKMEIKTTELYNHLHNLMSSAISDTK